MLAPEIKLEYLTDKELWKCIQENYMPAFTLLFRRHYSVLYTYGLKISQNENQTKDSIQDLFTELWSKRAGLSEVAAIKPYLFTILRRKIYQAKLTAAKQLEQHWSYQNYDFNIVISHEEFLIQEHQSESRHIKLREALMKLSPRQKEVIYLRFFDGLSCEAIAQITEVKYQSVVNIIHEAIKKIRETVVFSLLPATLLFCASSI